MKLDPLTIVILPERQRKNLGDLSEMIESIKRFGLINPITVSRSGEQYVLIAGERRLQSWLQARPNESIPCTLFEDLGPFDQKLLELDENTRRLDLSWQERALALASLDEMLRQVNEDWSCEKTAEYCGYSGGHVRLCTRMAEFQDNPTVWAAPTMAQARTLMDRAIQREIDRQSSKITGAAIPVVDLEEEEESVEEGEPGMASHTIREAIQAPSFEVLTTDFLEWASTYSGEPFTFIHCDFPYGINYGKSDQANKASGSYNAYDDDPKVFDKLLSCLDQHCDRVIAPVAHMLFWHKASMTYPIAQRLLASERGWRVLLVPLIWFRSDNRGIIADAERGPRHVYETALLCSRGDRRTFKIVSDVYSSPTSRDQHPSHKPIPMLTHFMSMVVDSETTVLDPTCGSGSALVAAQALGARRVLGIEKDPEFAEIAVTNLQRAHNLREASRLVSGE